MTDSGKEKQYDQKDSDTFNSYWNCVNNDKEKCMDYYIKYQNCMNIKKYCMIESKKYWDCIKKCDNHLG